MSEGEEGKKVTEATIIRFSALDRLAMCPSSLMESKGVESENSEASALGSARHEAMLELLRLQDPDAIDFDDIAARHGVASADVSGPIISCGYIPPAGAAGEMPVAIKISDEIMVGGTADLVILGTDPVVVDYKFSELRGDADDISNRWQVKGYAAAVGLASGYEDITAAIFNPLLGVDRGWSTERINVKQTIERIKEIVTTALDQYDTAAERRQYRQTTHCGFCPGSTTCPVLKKHRVTALQMINSNLPDVPREKFPWLYMSLRDMKKRIEAAMDMLKNDVRSANGDAIGDGMILGVRERGAGNGCTVDTLMSQLKSINYEAWSELTKWEAGLPKKTTQYVSLTKTKE